MSYNFFRISTAVFMGMLSLGGLPAAHALEASIDQFVVIKNGAILVDDKFDNGIRPKQEAVPPLRYTVRGVIDEVNGKATWDSQSGYPTNGLAGSNLGEPILINRARLRTSTAPLNVSTSGLKIDDTFEVRALFDLAVPEKKSDAYGISLSDRALAISNVGNDIVRISVRKTSIAGNNIVSFSSPDFETGFANRAGRAPLEENHDQILLILTRGDTSNTEIQARFAYVDGGSIDISGDLSGLGLTFTSLSNVITASTPADSPDIGYPITIFNDEEFTRTEFRMLVRDDVEILKLTSGSPASVSRTVDTPAEDFSVDFIYLFETTTGVLTVSLDGTPLAVIPAPATEEENFTEFSIEVTDTGLQGLPGVELKFEIDDDNPGATVLIDNIEFPGLPVENFADTTLSSWNTFGNATVLVVESAEDAEVEFDRAKLVEHKGLASFHIKGTLLFDVDNSDGLDLPEDVQVTIGGFAQTIPADMFHAIRRSFRFGLFRKKKKNAPIRFAVFHGGKPGIGLMTLWPDGRFSIRGRKVDLGGANVDEPVPFTLRVGNDLGQTEVEFDIFSHMSFGRK